MLCAVMLCLARLSVCALCVLLLCHKAKNKARAAVDTRSRRGSHKCASRFCPAVFCDGGKRAERALPGGSLHCTSHSRGFGELVCTADSPFGSRQDGTGRPALDFDCCQGRRPLFAPLRWRQRVGARTQRPERGEREPGCGFDAGRLEWTSVGWLQRQEGQWIAAF